MSVVVEASPADVVEKEWQPDRSITRTALEAIDIFHEGKPTCRLCGQRVNRLDTFGLCSKTSDTHQQYRGFPIKKARRR